MRRFVYIILFLAVLVAPVVLHFALKGRTDAGPADANAPELVIVTPHNQDIRQEFARAFSRWHREKYGQDVRIDYRVPGGTNDIKRLLEATFKDLEATAANPPGLDVVWGGGDHFFNNDLKPLGILQPLGLKRRLMSEVFPQPTLAGVNLYDQEVDRKTGTLLPPRWVGVCLSSFGIVYNPDLYRRLGLPEPTGWHDLTHEKLDGFVALADPTRSGSAAVAFMIVIQRHMADAEAAFPERDRMTQLAKANWKALEASGEDPEEVARLKAEYEAIKRRYNEALAAGWKNGMAELLLIAANARYFTDSASQVPHDVGNGQAAAGMAIDFYGRVYEESVGSGRCRFVSPPAATAITPDPVAILHGTRGPRLELARHFVEFLLTPDAQRLWILSPKAPGRPVERALRRPPIRRDVYNDRRGWTDDVNPFTESGGFNQRPEWMTLFSDTRMIWAAAWMDSRSALESAHAAILAVPDPRRREALLKELADLPVTMDDVARYRAAKKEQEAAAPRLAEEWKARRRIEWADTFRGHYRAVEKRARRSAPAPG